MTTVDTRPPPRRARTSSGARNQISLPAVPATVADARDFVARSVAAWNLDSDTGDSAVLIASELVTNAVTHTDGRSYHLTCRRGRHFLEIAVTDEGSARGVSPRTASNTDDEHGRGLAIVDALAHAWGTRPQGAGTRVWACLRQ